MAGGRGWVLHAQQAALGEVAPTEFGYGGVGGSNAWADTATGTAFALAKTRLAADFATSDQLSTIVRKAVAGD